MSRALDMKAIICVGAFLPDFNISQPLVKFISNFNCKENYRLSVKNKIQILLNNVIDLNTKFHYKLNIMDKH